MKKLTTADVIRDYSKLVQQWRKEHKGRYAIAKLLSTHSGGNCTPGTVQNVLRILENNQRQRIKVEDLDDDYDEMPIEELISLRISASNRKIKGAKKHKRSLLLPSKPFGIMCFGDPHVDNEGCDWSLLTEHVALAQSTDGVMAACVGDMQDNWIGRLARCYANSSVTASDGWRLSEWFMTSMQWIAMCGGNHDAWANGPGVDPMKLLTDKTGVLCYAPDEIRIVMHWKDQPDLEPIVWIIRHDFKGRSWFHPTHGPNKEAMLDGQCHILTAGHIHQWGQLTTEQRHGRCTHAIRVRGYKRADAYAMEKGYFEQEYGAAALIVLNPHLEGPGRITTFWDMEEGCKYLTYLRESFEEQS